MEALSNFIYDCHFNTSRKKNNNKKKKDEGIDNDGTDNCQPSVLSE